MKVSNKRKAMKSKCMCSGESGTALIEFAIVLPLLITILFGTIEFGLLMFNKQVLTNASREGARYGIVSQTDRYTNTDIGSVVNNYCASHLVTFGATNTPITTSNADTAASFGDNLSVSVTYNYDFLVMPINPITLSAQTIMKYE